MKIPIIDINIYKIAIIGIFSITDKFGKSDIAVLISLLLNNITAITRYGV